MSFYKYCPVCGYITTVPITKCIFCENSEIIETNIEVPDLFHQFKLKDEINNQIETQYKIKDNPLYSEEAVQRRLLQKKANGFRAERETTQKLAERNSAPLRCPKCNSTQVSIGQRGFTITTGFLGSNKTMNRCGNCGHKWYPKEK